MNDRITQLQLAVIGLLIDGEEFGRDLRDELAELKMKKSRPAFYQLMQRLEVAGYVEGSYEDRKTASGRMMRERKYRVLAPGKRAWEDARQVFVPLGLGLEGRA